MAANTDPITTGLTLLYRVLSSDGPFMGMLTGVYQDIAPVGTAPDYAVIGVQSPGVDVLSAFATRIFSTPLFRVLVTGPQADMANLSAAYQRADSLLAIVRNDNATGVLACYRTQPLYMPQPELVNGVPWVQLGGLYRMEM